MGRLRCWLLRKLIGNYKVMANVLVTSDIVEHNMGDLYLFKVKIKPVSRRQSFVYNPNNTRSVG